MCQFNRITGSSDLVLIFLFYFVFETKISTGNDRAEHGMLQ